MFIMSKPKALSIHTVNNREEVNDIMKAYGKYQNTARDGGSYSGFFPHSQLEATPFVYVYNIEKYRRKTCDNKKTIVREKHWKIWIYKLYLIQFSSITQNKHHFVAIS